MQNKNKYLFSIAMYENNHHYNYTNPHIHIYTQTSNCTTKPQFEQYYLKVHTEMEDGGVGCFGCGEVFRGWGRDSGVEGGRLGVWGGLQGGGRQGV